MALKERLTPEVLAELLAPPHSLSLTEVGLRFGNVSRQRVHQILSEYRKVRPELFKAPPEPSREQAESLLAAGHSLGAVADAMNISTSRLKRLLNRWGLHKQYLKESLSAEVLRRLYVTEERSDREIAALYHCSPSTVMKLRYVHGVYENQRRSLSEKLPRELFLALYDERGVKLEQLAELFGENLLNILALKASYRPTRRRAPGLSAKELEALRRELIQKGVITHA